MKPQTKIVKQMPISGNISKLALVLVLFFAWSAVSYGSQTQETDSNVDTDVDVTALVTLDLKKEEQKSEPVDQPYWSGQSLTYVSRLICD